jgi:hypothetical protein
VAESRDAFREIKVRLAEVPTDVLVWLCEQSAGVSVSFSVIADAVAPPGSVEARASVARSLRLLLDAGYMEGEFIDGSPLFRASAAGRRAVAEAPASGEQGVEHDVPYDGRPHEAEVRDA